MTHLPAAASAVLAGLCLALAAACTPTPPDVDRPPTTPTATPAPTPAPVHIAELRLPPGPATVLDLPDAVSRAAATSETFYASAPVAVLAPAADIAAQVRAAGIAVTLGAPLLLTAPTTAPAVAPTTPAADPAADPATRQAATPTVTPDAGAPADPTRIELDRLGVLAVVTVGDVGSDLASVVGDAAVVAAPRDDAELAAVLLVDPDSSPMPATGTEQATAAALDRDAPTVPSPAVDQGPAVPTTPATSSRTPTPTASPDRTGTALPLTELAEPLDGGLLLTTGDPMDLAALATARAAGVTVLTVPTGDPRADSPTVRGLAGAAATSVVGLGPAFGSAETLAWKSQTAATGTELPGGGQLVFAGRRFVALYGTPTFPALGILGEQDPAASVARAQELAAQYQVLTSDVVVPAFEIIVTIASAGAGADGNYSNELPAESFIPWIEAARDGGVYVVLDLQPGRTDFLTQAKAYESLLLYPNVGLALDPEWRLAPDQVHLRQIGSVHVDEVNAVTGYLAELTRTNHLPQKVLVLHQFMQRMIQGRELVDTSHEEVAVLIHADGQGSQGAKAGTWAALHEGAPAGVRWGWKNFLDEDLPVLDPAQTYQVVPVPEFVSYQ